MLKISKIQSGVSDSHFLLELCTEQLLELAALFQLCLFAHDLPVFLLKTMLMTHSKMAVTMFIQLAVSSPPVTVNCGARLHVLHDQGEQCCLIPFFNWVHYDSVGGSFGHAEHPYLKRENAIQIVNDF